MLSLCARVEAGSLANRWPLGTASSLRSPVPVGHPGAGNGPPGHLQPKSLCLPTPRAGCVPELPWCQRSSASGLSSSYAPAWEAQRAVTAAAGGPEDAHLVTHKPLILPKLTWQRPPEAHVPAGKRTHRLLPTGGPSAGGRARSKGYMSWGGARISACPGGWGARRPLASPLPSAAGSLSLPAAPERCSPAGALEIVVDVTPSREVGHSQA